jgi:hypothetical protein
MDYQGNSNKSKEVAKPELSKEKKVEKAVLEGKVVARKKPITTRLKTIFFGGEVDSAARYIAAEVLIPAFRNVIVDATTKGIERMVYGDSQYSRARPAQYQPKVTYNTPVNRAPMRGHLPDQPSTPRRHRSDETELIFGSRSDAEMVLERLSDIIDQYMVASVADLNEIVGLPTNHVDNKWGWENVRFAEIRQTRDGFILNLPPVQPL